MNIDGTKISSLIRSEKASPNKYTSWRSELTNVDVWYACYGSNMWKSRLMCYIEGGKVEGMKKSCRGSMDKTKPKDVRWKIVPHKLFFGRSASDVWGAGGVAFLHPQIQFSDTAYICMYKITLEQFSDILFQENHMGEEIRETQSPLIDLFDLDIVSESKSMNIEALKDSWYNSVVLLGTEDDIPILTMTCSLSDIKRYKSGEIPMLPPPKGYANTLIKGLIEGEKFTEKEANDYINDAISITLAKNI